MMRRREFMAAGAALWAPARRLNVVQILIDDMGYADLGCFGGEIATPNIDRLAAKGTRFERAYVASPVCSPSRVGLLTGQFPARQGIHSYLDTRQRHRELGQRDFLDAGAPSVARAFQRAGYATGHFGKWHMGGGRDIGEAPLPTEYGFDESYTSFEGLGDRVLPPGQLSVMNEKLGRGKIAHAPQSELTGIYVDRSIDFVQRSLAARKPFYLHLWPNEVHDPFEPKAELMKKYERFAANRYVQQYYAMLDNLDQQVGRLVETIERAGEASNTLFLLLSDNGPTAWPRYYKEKLDPPGRTAGLRGRKWSLYEGGIRTPLIARWDGHVQAGRVDRESVVSSVDFFPTCCSLAGVETGVTGLDGENRAGVFLGKAAKRKTELYWDYGRTKDMPRPGLERDQSPNLAVRSGEWKLLVNGDGSRVELYDFRKSDREEENVAGREPKVAKELTERVLGWRKRMGEVG